MANDLDHLSLGRFSGERRYWRHSLADFFGKWAARLSATLGTAVLYESTLNLG